MIRVIRASAVCIFSLLLLVGCARSVVSTPPATQPATAINPATTQPNYWLSQPAAATASAGKFQMLWAACEDAARDYFFQLDRSDWRSGVLTTRPMVSSQFFEPWRRELQSAHDVAESSLATVRRTIRFEISGNEESGFTASPKVLVERQALAERRLTSVVMYRSVFGGRVGSGTRESDQGISLPQRYWYPIGRDEKFERVLAEAVERRVKRLAGK